MMSVQVSWWHVIRQNRSCSRAFVAQRHSCSPDDMIEYRANRDSIIIKTKQNKKTHKLIYKKINKKR